MGGAAASPRILTGAEKITSDLQKLSLFHHPQNLSILKGCAILLLVKGHYVFTTKTVWKEASVWKI